MRGGPCLSIFNVGPFEIKQCQSARDGFVALLVESIDLPKCIQIMLRMLVLGGGALVGTETRVGKQAGQVVKAVATGTPHPHPSPRRKSIDRGRERFSLPCSRCWRTGEGGGRGVIYHAILHQFAQCVQRAIRRVLSGVEEPDRNCRLAIKIGGGRGHLPPARFEIRGGWS